MKYKAKPKIIEAIQLTKESYEECINWLGVENIDLSFSGRFAGMPCFIDVQTPDGILQAREGDYIIKWISGGFYPCKRDVFEENYELAE